MSIYSFFNFNLAQKKEEALNFISENPVYQQYFSNINPALFLAQFMHESDQLCPTCRNSLGYYGLGVTQAEIDQAYQEGVIPNNEPSLRNEIYTAFDRYKHYLHKQCAGITDPLAKVKCVMNTYNGHSSYFDEVLKTYHRIAGLPILDSNPSITNNLSMETLQALSQPAQALKKGAETIASPILNLVEEIGTPIAFIAFALLLFVLAVLVYRKKPQPIIITLRFIGKNMRKRAGAVV